MLGSLGRQCSRFGPEIVDWHPVNVTDFGGRHNGTGKPLT